MTPTEPQARILDRGYRRYTDERLGTPAAMKSVGLYTAQRVLGIHRKSRFKVLPVLVILMTFVPAIVYVGVVVLNNQFEQESGIEGGDVIIRSLVSDYPDLFGNVIAAILLFAAFVAPEVLCTDRRTGMLGLYLASTLDRFSYLTAKLVTVLLLMLIVTLGPGLVLLIGYGTQGYGPDGLRDWITTTGQLLLAGVGVGMFHTTIALAISSATSRRAAASAAFVMLTMGTGFVIPILIEEADMSTNWGALNVLTLPLEFAYRVFGQPSELVFGGRPEMSTPWVYSAMVVWMVASMAFMWDRYRRVEVAR